MGHWRAESLEDRPSLQGRVTGGQVFTTGQSHWRTGLHYRTESLEDRLSLQDRVTGGQAFAGERSLEDGPSLEDRVTGGPAFTGVLSQEDRLCWRTGSLEGQSLLEYDH